MRARYLCGMAMLICTLAGAQEEVDFAEEGDNDRLESILADLREAQGLALRWRVRGAMQAWMRRGHGRALGRSRTPWRRWRVVAKPCPPIILGFRPRAA